MDADTAHLMRKLPSNVSFAVEDVETWTVEVMLMVLHGAANHYVQR